MWISWRFTTEHSGRRRKKKKWKCPEDVYNIILISRQYIIVTIIFADHDSIMGTRNRSKRLKNYYSNNTRWKYDDCENNPNGLFNNNPEFIFLILFMLLLFYPFPPPPPPRFFLDFVGRNYGHGLLFDGATVTSAKWDFGTGVRTGKFWNLFGG